MPNDAGAATRETVSIVICTDDRAAALENTLLCLEYLEGPPFEVCVVAGPTEDGTAEVLARRAGHLRVARNPERNLSASRNIGISMAAGDFVAFVDDDGLPEPEWLPQVLRPFDDPWVAAAGGVVMNHTGTQPQYLYASADRLGNPDWQRTMPADDYNFPYSFNFPYVQGTNSMFRRAALLQVGGFDEEFELYLDETDLCCRLTDAGFGIRQLPNAVVHHKFLPSAIRTADRVTRVLYPVLKNKLYFSLINNHGHYPTRRAIEDMVQFARDREADLRFHLNEGRVCYDDLARFHSDLDRAWEVGLQRGLSRQRRQLQPALLDRYRGSFLPYPRRIPAGGSETFVFVSQEFPPTPVGGIGRHVHELSRSVAVQGHQVHVVTTSDTHDRLDFEEGVWVHRAVTKDKFRQNRGDVPPHIWARARTVLEVVRKIAASRPVAAVHAPIWDAEGAAVLFDGTFPLVTGLHTTLKLWMESFRHIASAEDYQRNFARLMLPLEERLMLECDAIHANSASNITAIENRYGIILDSARTTVIHHGVSDWLQLPATPADRVPDGTLRLLFVGRLEARKGIDLLLRVLPQLLANYPQLHADIVGKDTIPGPSVETYRATFEAAVDASVRDRTRFYGEVSEEVLRGLYQACDIFVAPSRYESFGLILVEAMMFGKPVVSCRTGGIVEVARENVTALLASPGDEASLRSCLVELIEDPALRLRLGTAGRRRYEENFTPAVMAHQVVSLLRAARTAHTTHISAAAQ
jgi:glycogen(starch) synthase